MISFDIIWSPKAELTYLHILEYLEEEWTNKEIEHFMHRTAEVIKHIASNPLLYPYSVDSATHKCVVVKQVSLFYAVQITKVQLLVFWDNRQNPATLLL